MPVCVDNPILVLGWTGGGLAAQWSNYPLTLVILMVEELSADIGYIEAGVTIRWHWLC
jgi:hypothetical protein